MSKEKRAFSITTSLVGAFVLAGALVAVAPVAGAATCVDGGLTHFDTFTLSISGEGRRYRAADAARIHVLVERKIEGERLPVEEVHVSVLLSQGDAIRGSGGFSDAEGTVSLRIPLEWFDKGHIDARAFARKSHTPAVPCVGEVREAGKAVALDLIRVVRR